MTHGHVLRRKLLSFLHSRQEVAGWLEPEFDPGMLELVHLPLFGGFEWTTFRTRHGASVFGIRPNQTGIPKREIARAGFDTESMVVHSLVVRLGSAEHYLVAELQSPKRIVMTACAHAPPTEWYLLEEHVLARSAL